MESRKFVRHLERAGPKDYEILPQTHETFVQVAMIRLMCAKACLVDLFNTFQTSS